MVGGAVLKLNWFSMLLEGELGTLFCGVRWLFWGCSATVAFAGLGWWLTDDGALLDMIASWLAAVV